MCDHSDLSVSLIKIGHYAVYVKIFFSLFKNERTWYSKNTYCHSDSLFQSYAKMTLFEKLWFILDRVWRWNGSSDCIDKNKGLLFFIAFWNAHLRLLLTVQMRNANYILQIFQKVVHIEKAWIARIFNFVINRSNKK